MITIAWHSAIAQQEQDRLIMSNFVQVRRLLKDQTAEELDRQLKETISTGSRQWSVIPDPN